MRMMFITGVWFFLFSGMASLRPAAAQVSVSGCHADFSYTVDPENPLRIIFTDYSSGSIDTWQWSFGDGSTTLLQNPVHTYPQGGTYFVCLTVSGPDSGVICNDVLCIAITIHEPGKCIADFSYKAEGGDHLTVRFSDLSSGPVDRWHWDFGDGTVSEDRNPVHRFSADGGYRVCLVAYKSDSASFCSDVKCDTVHVMPQLPCHAGFTVLLDTMNQKPNTFIFTNVSTGGFNRSQWTIDESITYTSTDVIHQFGAPGIHKVCLTIAREFQGKTICSDSLCLEVFAERYFQLGGHLFAGNYPINNPSNTGDTGIAYLYRKSGNAIVPFDTMVFTHLGYFTFPQILGGNYLVRNALTTGSHHYSNFFPAYYPVGLTWYDAPLVTVGDPGFFRADVNLIPVLPYTPGIGKISGDVSKEGSMPVSVKIRGASVILFNQEMQPVQLKVSQPDGRFEFIDLAFGAYNLYVDYPGLYSRLTPVWLDENRPLAGEMNLVLFEHDVTGINDHATNSFTAGDPFPNPAGDFVRIPVDAELTAFLDYGLFNITGMLITSGKWRVTPGKSDLTIPVGQLSPGFYFITLTPQGGIQRQVLKFLKF